MNARLRPRARADVSEIVDYLTAQSASAAAELPDAIRRTLELIQQVPGIGEDVELRKRRLIRLRKLPLIHFKKYMVYYVVADDIIKIVRILHVARDRHAILKDEF